MVEQPAEHHVARVLFRVAEHFGYQPEEIIATGDPSRPRIVALAVLKFAYDKLSWTVLAQRLNFANPDQASSLALNACKRDWWPAAMVDELVGEIVAPLYGSQAE